MSNKKNNKKVNLLKDQMFLTKKYVDINDPIYDSESEDENCFYTVLNAEEIAYSQKLSEMKNKMNTDMTLITFEAFEKKCEVLLSSFFYERKVQDVVESVKEIEVKTYNDYFVFQLIKKSFDYDEECQTNVSCLLNALNLTNLITPEQVQRAFEKILLSLEDIRLDVPSCYQIFLNYLRFAILDNVIDYTYIYKLPIFFFDQLEIASLTYDTIEERLSQIPENDETLHGNEYNKQGKNEEEDGVDADYNFDKNSVGKSSSGKKFKEVYRETLEWLLKINIKDVEKEKMEFKEKTRNFLIDFFNDGSISEVVEFLDSTNQIFHHEFVRISIVESFSKTNICRKMVSHILDCLCGRQISKNDIILGFLRVIGEVDSYEIDCPNAREYVCKFLLRCIYDDVLYPAFLSDAYRIHLGGITGMSICNKTQQRINNRKKMNFNNLDYIWDDDDTYETMRMKRNISNTLLEYFYQYIDEEECFMCFDETLPINQDLCDYIVKKIFIQNMDIHEESSLSLKLLDYLYRKNYIENANIEQGIQIIVNSLEDIILDIPKFPQEMKTILKALIERKYITDDFYDETLEKLNKY